MFYVQKVQKSTSKKQVIIDGVLQSEEFTENILNFYFNLDENDYVSDFSNKTLFSSLSEIYDLAPKKFEFDEEGEVKFISDPDISSLSKEQGIELINENLNFLNVISDPNPTVEYFVVEE